jgi:hypothetical protein
MSGYSPPTESGRGVGWAGFAATVFLILGIFNLLDGIVALTNDDFFRADELLFGDLSMWGAIFLVVGAVQILTAFLIFRGAWFGRLMGIGLASLNAVLALLSVGAYPIWSLLILALDGVVIYALTVYGDALGTAD